MSSPLPPNMAMTTVRGRYGTWDSVAGQPSPVFRPYVGLEVRFAPAYPFVTNTTATPSPIVVATAPRIFRTDASGYLSDPQAGFDGSGNGLNRNCVIVSSDDPDIWPHDWKYLVTFSGQGATNFRAFRTPAASNSTVDIAVLTPQRVPQGSTPSTAEVAAADAAASAAAAQEAVANIRRGQAGGVAGLDADGDVIDADGTKVLPGGSGGSGTPDLSAITGMSTLGKNLVATLVGGSPATQTNMRAVIGAGTGNSNLAIGTAAGTAADAAATTNALALRALNTQTIHTTGDETKDGVLTFLDPPNIPAGVAPTNPVTKAQLDAVASGGTSVTAASIGLGNVNDTSDLNKPVSTAQAAALALKADKNNAAFTGTFTTAAGAIPQASVSGLVSAVSTLGNTVTLYGDIPRAHPVSGAVLPAPPTVTVMWVTVGAAARPAAFNTSGDIWLNEELT